MDFSLNLRERSAVWLPFTVGLILTILVMLLSGCQVLLVSHYDAETDKGVTELQREVATHLAKLKAYSTNSNGELGAPKSPDCKFENFAGSYVMFGAQAHSLVVRNEARAKNALTTAQLKELEGSLLMDLATFHREAEEQCLKSAAVDAVSKILDQHFGAVLKLELAKKIYRSQE
jgi:hypothetical protein